MKYPAFIALYVTLGLLVVLTACLFAILINCNFAGLLAFAELLQ